MQHWDLIVVGVGAVGAAALRAAAEAGARTLGLEQFVPAGPRGSSHGHARIFRHAYFEHPDYVPLLRHSTGRLESLERDSGAALLHRCGMLLLGGPASAIVAGALESARRWRLPLTALDAAALRSRYPWFEVANDAVGAFEADAGIVRAERTVQASVQVALARGAELRTGARVRRFDEDAHGVTVTTDAGTERAAALIVAAGPWSSVLLPELASRLTVTRQVQAWATPTPGTDVSTLPCWLVDRGADRRALYGLPRDPAADGGSPQGQPKLALHGSDVVVDPERGAADVTPADTEAILSACRGIAPSLAGRVQEATTCLYTMSPDGHFIVGTRPGSRRTHFAAGLSGHGFKLAPALGDALVDLALLGRSALPIGFLAPGRLRTAAPTGG